MASAPLITSTSVEALGSESRYWSLFEALQRWPGQQYTDELTPPARGGKKPRTFTRRGMNEAGGDRGATIVVYKDITRDKAIDRAKDEFLSNVTHELRSPLASIKGFAEMMRRDPQMQAGRRTNRFDHLRGASGSSNWSRNCSICAGSRTRGWRSTRRRST